MTSPARFLAISPAIGFDLGWIANEELVLVRLLYCNGASNTPYNGLLHSMRAKQAIELGIALIEEGMRATSANRATG
jgi:hypothetical protein